MSVDGFYCRRPSMCTELAEGVMQGLPIDRLKCLGIDSMAFQEIIFCSILIPTLQDREMNTRRKLVVTDVNSTSFGPKDWNELLRLPLLWEVIGRLCI